MNLNMASAKDIPYSSQKFLANVVGAFDNVNPMSLYVRLRPDSATFLEQLALDPNRSRQKARKRVEICNQENILPFWGLALGSGSAFNDHRMVYQGPIDEKLWSSVREMSGLPKVFSRPGSQYYSIIFMNVTEDTLQDVQEAVQGFSAGDYFVESMDGRIYRNDKDRWNDKYTRFIAGQNNTLRFLGGPTEILTPEPRNDKELLSRVQSFLEI